MNAPILITGCARSGTSMTAGIIDRHGAFGGETVAGGPVNPKGFFENSEIRQNISKPYLTLCGADPMGQSPLPFINNLLPLANLRSKVEQIMKFQGYTNGPWYYKGAKMCLVWPTWNVAFPEGKWIIVRRDDTDITESCMNTGFMRAYRTVDGWQIWVDAHKMRFKEMMANCKNVKEVWPIKFVNGDYSEIKSVVEWAGLTFDEQIVKDMVVPNRFRNKEAGRVS